MPHSVLSDFRNCFAGTPNIKFALVIIKDFTTAETHRYTILWNISRFLTMSTLQHFKIAWSSIWSSWFSRLPLITFVSVRVCFALRCHAIVRAIFWLNRPTNSSRTAGGERLAMSHLAARVTHNCCVKLTLIPATVSEMTRTTVSVENLLVSNGMRQLFCDIATDPDLHCIKSHTFGVRLTHSTG